MQRRNDLQHQLSNTTYEVNAQGRTETWYRIIPNYVMLRVAWQFNKNPKNKESRILNPIHQESW